MVNKALIKISTKVNQMINKAEALIEEAKNTKFTKKLPKFIATASVALSATVLSPVTVFAAGSNTQSIDKFIDFACEWLIKIGGVIMLVGGVMFALGWQREDAEGKSRGLLTLMAGGMLAALGASKSLFGL